MADYRAEARRAALRYGLDPHIFVRQINQESGFAPDVISGRRRSSAGALGIAQIMPATARGWGVNPLDPKAALNAAAKNMAAYVRRYGSYENALRAYNAGPAAIEKSKGYRETNHYVQVILRGRDPGRLQRTRDVSSTRSGGGELQQPQQPAATTRTVTDPGVDNSGIRRQLLASYLLQRDRPDALLSLGSGLKQAQDVPGTTRTETIPGQPTQPRKVRPSRPKAGTPTSSKEGTPGVVRELFYDPVGAWDEGRKIPAIGGHSDHVHVSARSHGAAVSLAKTAQRFGLTVRELEPFDKVDPVHTQGSYHYSGRALDVSGAPDRMKAYTNYLRRKYRLR